MNKLMVSMLNKVNQDTCMFFKKQEHIRKALRHKTKINSFLEVKEVLKLEEEFDVCSRDDVDTNYSPVLIATDYKSIAELTKFLREEYKSNFPDVIEVYEDKYRIEYRLISINYKPLNFVDCISLNNGFNKYYTYLAYLYKNPCSLSELTPRIREIQEFIKLKRQEIRGE